MILETVFHVPGGILGAMIVSRIADKMGRRLSFLVSLISCLTVGTMISSCELQFIPFYLLNLKFDFQFYNHDLRLTSSFIFDLSDVKYFKYFNFLLNLIS